MIKYEYSTVRLDYNTAADKAAQKLRELGNDGWELISILPDSTPKAGIAFFKKPIKE